MKKIFTISLIASAIFSNNCFAKEKKDYQKHQTKMFEKMDSDDDGNISKYEWQKNHNDRFTEIDGDADGSLTKEEMRVFHEKMKEKFKDKKAE